MHTLNEIPFMNSKKYEFMQFHPSITPHSQHPPQKNKKYAYLKIWYLMKNWPILKKIPTLINLKCSEMVCHDPVAPMTTEEIDSRERTGCRPSPTWWGLGTGTTHPLVSCNQFPKPWKFHPNWSNCSKVIHDFPKTQTKKQCDPISSKFYYFSSFKTEINQFSVTPSFRTFIHNLLTQFGGSTIDQMACWQKEKWRLTEKNFN